MSIFIHVGAPKTASTFLQGFLELNAEELKRNGTIIYTPKTLADRLFYKYHLSQHFNSDKNISLDDAKDDFQNIINNNENTVISQEGFLHDLMPSSRTNGRFGGVERAAKSLYSLSDGNADIIITIRNQVDFLDSAYKHRIKWQGESASFPEYFFYGVNIFELSWKAVVDVFEKYFPGRIRLMPYELIKLDEKKFIQYFLSHVGFNDKKLKLKYGSEVHVKNRSLSNTESLIVRMLNNKLKDVINFDDSKKHELITFMNQFLKNSNDENIGGMTIPPGWRKSITDYYLDENEKLMYQYCADCYDDVIDYYKC